jgi:alpha-ketoglutarate-dependent taurine dioxygenase
MSTIGLLRLKRTPGSARRQPMSLSPDALVSLGPMAGGQTLPLLAQPTAGAPAIDLARWVSAHRALVDTELLKAGGLLFRGFGIRSAGALRAVIDAWSGEPMAYTDHATPRHEIADQVYSSTDYPADQAIELHNECAYARSWPMKVFFCCQTAAATGGETPIADCRRVLARLRPETVARFESRGLMYVRNFGEGIGTPWSTVFGTNDLREVQAACERAGIELEHKGSGRLRTRQRRPAIARHPRCGEPVWFNQAVAFHITSVEPAVRRTLLDQLGEIGVPKNVFYGDGEPIEPSTLDEIRDAVRDCTVMFPWQEGDLLVLDNMLTAHGRMPYTGARKVLAGMAEPC